MGMYGIETRTCEAKNFFAGDFQTLTETGTAGGELVEHTPVTENSEGKIVAVTAETVANVVGITAATRCILHDGGIFSGSIKHAGRRYSRRYKRTVAENVNFPADIELKGRIKRWQMKQ